VQPIQEITSIADIQRLAVAGFTDWIQYGEVNVKRDGDLLLFDYTAKAQYAARWNFFERVSRGLIIHARTGEIVARPFDKFFNWFEGGRKAHGHIVSVTEKIDGSLGILFRLNGNYRITTRGDFFSPQGAWATKFLNEHFDLRDLPNELTLLFEIIYPENRIVIDYHGREALILLAARNRFTGAYMPFFPDLYELAQKYNFPLPNVYSFNNITEILERTGTLPAEEEGYVVEFSDGERYKFKGDRYLELHKLISGLSFKHTLEAVQAGTVAYIREQIPDEHLAEFNAWVLQIETVVAATKQKVQAAFDAAPKDSRKEFALYVQQHHKHLAPYLFAMLDGKEYTPLIYRNEFEALLKTESERTTRREV
jgi:RNA ligase